MKQTSSAAGHTSKHAWVTYKHSKTSKHTPAKTVSSKTGGKTTVTAVAKPVVGAKAVGLSLGEGVACCAAEALAASLRLSGRPVADEDVLALYWHTAGDEDAGASILSTLEAAWRYGLGGVRPARWGMAWRDSNPQTPAHSAPTRAHISAWAPAPDSNTAPGHPYGHDSALILQVELPGPHAVLATPEGWWSWGELHDPAEWPDAVVEEAWAIQWGAGS